ncbi:hypothetical protein JXA85_01915 [Candidatus Woesearchaeota archaeon]|nr:hypothetical protein [Candidatus Woesearchaeota archaeon]
MEREEKIQELARTLKATGLVASMSDAEERAREILKPNASEKEGIQETLVKDKSSPGYDIGAEDKTVAELMAEDAEAVYAAKENLEQKPEPKEFMVKTEQEIDEEKNEGEMKEEDFFNIQQKE